MLNNKKRALDLHAIKGYHTLYTPTSKHTQNAPT